MAVCRALISASVDEVLNAVCFFETHVITAHVLGPMRHNIAPVVLFMSVTSVTPSESRAGCPRPAREETRPREADGQGLDCLDPRLPERAQ